MQNPPRSERTRMEPDRKFNTVDVSMHDGSLPREAAGWCDGVSISLRNRIGEHIFQTVRWDGLFVCRNRIKGREPSADG